VSTIVLVRHGETEWSRSGRHTGRTDVPLTEQGRRDAAALATRLAGGAFALVLTSPARRALDTCAAAGYGSPAVPTDLAREWDYGAYEGRTTADIRTERPGWSLWRDGVPDGESIEQVASRADALLAEIAGAEGDALVFSHGHFLRVVAARWLGLPASDGRLFALGPASISALGWEREQPVLSRWNDTAEGQTQPPA
jgi:probable phosphoglycerate mutase